MKGVISCSRCDADPVEKSGQDKRSGKKQPDSEKQLDDIENLDDLFEGWAVRAVCVTREHRLQKCRHNAGNSGDDADLSIGKSPSQKEKSGKTHDRSEIHPVQSLDTGIRSREVFAFGR